MTQLMAPGSDANDAIRWNLKRHFLEAVSRLGGLANNHAHFDKAYLIDIDSLRLCESKLEEKWKLFRDLKKKYTYDDLVERISRAVENMLQQGVTYCRSMVDADSIVGLLPMQAAKEVQRRYAGKIRFEIGVQPLEGVLNPAAFEQFEAACKMADYCGGLPSRDHPREAEHLDIILDVAKRLNKPIDVHVDQSNNPQENETEMLAEKTVEFGLQGRVFAVHATSLASKSSFDQYRIMSKIVEADLGIIICPSAAISTRQLWVDAPIHNSIAPYPKLLRSKIRCYLGTDNIHDLFMPIADGDIWTECRFLMEACRFYDIEAISQLATARPNPC